MQKIVLIISSLLFLATQQLVAQETINPKNIKIARDQWGVAHIFAPTDAEVAYGMAWACGEDDFGTAQYLLLACKNKTASVLGKDQVALDVICHLMGIRELVDTAYHENTFSKEYRKVLLGYMQGINAYAAKHPKEILAKGVFPITEKDLVTAYALGYLFISSLPAELFKMRQGYFDGKSVVFQEKGSNAIAISKKRTTDDKTFLVANPHQPVEGPFSWHEVHLCSEEGWNIIGGAMPLTSVVGLGVNENLGWAHTVNYMDFVDIYELKTNPKNKMQYEFDGKWETLVKRPLKLKVKVKGVIVGKKMDFYWSKYGATLERKGKFYSLRCPANMNVKAVEQHYWMNKAKNYKEFRAALDLQYHNSFNIVYADREDNIFYLNNGRIPYRNPNYNWKTVLPGNTSATLWTPKFHPVDELPHLLNPENGILFNTNHTNFKSMSGKDLSTVSPDKTIGVIDIDNNRSRRFQELLQPIGNDKISYNQFKTMRSDVTYPKDLNFLAVPGLEKVFTLDGNKYPDIKDILAVIQKWNRKSDVQNTSAGAFIVFMNHFAMKLVTYQVDYYTATEQDLVDALRKAKKHLIKHFGKLEFPYGDIHRHYRGGKDYPAEGCYDILAASNCKMYKDGKFHTYIGDGYIQYTRFSKNSLPEIETINAFGESLHKESPHYTDQLEMAAQHKVKKMTLDKKEVLRDAKRVYSPE